jgi:outer membrane protein OmpA-like peptidoglycan-associated protein
VLKNIFFESGKSEISPQSSTELERLVKVLKDNPSIRIEISGHTDNVGDPKANQSLSELRAQEVMKYLVLNGIDKSRITAKGYGSSVPLESNDTEEGRMQNRRTEFKIL